MRSPTKRPVIQHPLNHDLYQYNLAPPFNSNIAGLEIFEPLFTLPIYSTKGAGRYFRKPFHALQPPQVWFTQQNGVVGLGGIQSGQLISQPLIDPSQFEGV